MIVTKKCAVCGYHFNFDDTLTTNMYLSPNSEGAKLYFDLWHFNVEKCPNCGYASKDVSTCLNNSIVKDAKYDMISKNKIVKTLNSARPNKLEHYLKASLYYKSVNDKLNESLCNLQASDLIYGEMLYWKDYILDDSANTMNAVQNKKEYEELKTFADELYVHAIAGLKEYFKENPSDVDHIILLAGTLSDGNKMQKIQAVNMLNKLKTVKGLTLNQKKMIKFLLEMIRA